ncbi:hypothetical protein ADUPG1_010153, partial [Aduncisulcus paluster]
MGGSKVENSKFVVSFPISPQKPYEKLNRHSRKPHKSSKISKRRLTAQDSLKQLHKVYSNPVRAIKNKDHGQHRSKSAGVHGLKKYQKQESIVAKYTHHPSPPTTSGSGYDSSLPLISGDYRKTSITPTLTHHGSVLGDRVKLYGSRSKSAPKSRTKDRIDISPRGDSTQHSDDISPKSRRFSPKKSIDITPSKRLPTKKSPQVSYSFGKAQTPPPIVRHSIGSDRSSSIHVQSPHESQSTGTYVPINEHTIPSPSIITALASVNAVTAVMTAATRSTSPLNPIEESTTIKAPILTPKSLDIPSTTNHSLSSNPATPTNTLIPHPPTNPSPWSDSAISGHRFHPVPRLRLPWTDQKCARTSTHMSATSPASPSLSSSHVVPKIGFRLTDNHNINHINNNNHSKPSQIDSKSGEPKSSESSQEESQSLPSKEHMKEIYEAPVSPRMHRKMFVDTGLVTTPALSSVVTNELDKMTGNNSSFSARVRRATVATDGSRPHTDRLAKERALFYGLGSMRPFSSIATTSNSLKIKPHPPTSARPRVQPSMAQLIRLRDQYTSMSVSLMPSVLTSPYGISSLQHVPDLTDEDLEEIKERQKKRKERMKKKREKNEQMRQKKKKIIEMRKKKKIEIEKENERIAELEAKERQKKNQRALQERRLEQQKVEKERQLIRLRKKEEKRKQEAAERIQREIERKQVLERRALKIEEKKRAEQRKSALKRVQQLVA